MARTTPNPSANDPWAPLVLSLDGGGIRGLSSLYILREIMSKIKELDDQDISNQIEPSTDIPLPCNYFDFIIGTSTGGLIAIMLGRLRMGVDDCIQRYWILANMVFLPHRTRFIQKYSRRGVQEAAKDVVRRFCCCHSNHSDCVGLEPLRQYDYTEQGPNKNKTCKVAVVTVREGGTTTHQKVKPADVLILFRSYDHLPRHDHPTDPGYELNPRGLLYSNLSIHKACSCTSAAPTYFKSVQLSGRSYIDGGVMANNPAQLAWNEARQMANPLATPQAPLRLPTLLVSIGTGKAKEHSRFGTKSLVLGALKKIADTGAAHQAMRSLIASQPHSKYVRLDVPEENSVDPQQKGLADIGLDHCKKRRKPTTTPPTLANAAISVSVRRVEQRDSVLMQNAAETKKGGYKPNKYRYVTFEKIRDRTAIYCDTTTATQEILKCAKTLRDQSILRKTNDQQRWNDFRSHPDPAHH